jgi:hypothetical protein
MAINDNIRSAGLAASQNFGNIVLFLDGKADATRVPPVAAQKQAAPVLYVVRNAAIPAAEYEKILTGSDQVSAKASALTAHFTAGVTDVNFILGGVAGLHAASVVAVHLEVIDPTTPATSDSILLGPADVVYRKGEALPSLAGADLVLDSENGAIIGKLAGVAEVLTSKIVKLSIHLKY